VPYVGDDFPLRQRRELSARRIAYREQLARLSERAGVEPDRVLPVLERAKRRIEEIDAALHRLDAGTYGACRSCRRPIPVPRLEAVPEATQCMACASGVVGRRGEPT